LGFASLTANPQAVRSMNQSLSFCGLLTNLLTGIKVLVKYTGKTFETNATKPNQSSTTNNRIRPPATLKATGFRVKHGMTNELWLAVPRDSL